MRAQDRRADIEESKSSIALNAPLPLSQLSLYNFSDTSSRKKKEVGIIKLNSAPVIQSRK